MQWLKISLNIFVFMVLAFGFGRGMLYSDDNTLFSKLTISAEDIPQGFVFGKVPNFAKNVFPNNPCIVNSEGIRFLVPKLYPEGNATNIKSMYVAIMTTEDRPYGDDLVYYLLIFKDSKSATAEIKKLNEYYQWNKDRIVLISKDTIALLLFTDDIANYKYIEQLAQKLQVRLNQ